MDLLEGKLQFRQGTALLQSCKDRQLQLIEKPGILFPSGCPLSQNFCQHLFFHSPAPSQSVYAPVRTLFPERCLAVLCRQGASGRTLSDGLCPSRGTVVPVCHRGDRTLHCCRVSTEKGNAAAQVLCRLHIDFSRETW